MPTAVSVASGWAGHLHRDAPRKLRLVPRGFRTEPESAIGRGGGVAAAGTSGIRRVRRRPRPIWWTRGAAWHFGPERTRDPCRVVRTTSRPATWRNRRARAWRRRPRPIRWARGAAWHFGPERTRDPCRVVRPGARPTACRAAHPW